MVNNMNIILLILFIVSFNVSAVVTTEFVPGPAPATFERTPTTTKYYVNVPSGGHSVRTIDTSIPNASKSFSDLLSKTYVSKASTLSAAAAESNVSLPLTNGQKIMSNVKYIFNKPELASKTLQALKSAPGFIAKNAGAGAAMWLGMAGIQWVADHFMISGPYYYSAGLATYETCVNSPWLCGNTPADLSQAYGDNYVATHSLLNANADHFCGFDGNPLYWTGHYVTPSSGYGQITVEECSSNGISLRRAATVNIARKDNASRLYGSPATDQQAQDTLSSSPMSSSGDSAQAFDDALDQLFVEGLYPKSNEPIVSGDTTPVVVDSSTTANPDGSTVTTTDSVRPSYNNDNSVTLSKDRSVTTTSPTGQVSTQTTTSNLSASDFQTGFYDQNLNNQTATSSDSGSATDSGATDQKDPCIDNPNRAGCLDLGVVPDSEVIPVTPVPVFLSPVSLGVGSCPAPMPIHTSFKDFSISWQPVCDFGSMLRPLIIAIGWMSAGFIVIGGVRD